MVKTWWIRRWYFLYISVFTMLPNFRETRHEKFGVLQTYLDLIHNSSFSVCIPFLNSNSFIKVHRPPLYLYCFPLLFAFLYEPRLQSKDLNIRTIKCFLIFKNHFSILYLYAITLSWPYLQNHFI